MNQETKVENHVPGEAEESFPSAIDESKIAEVFQDMAGDFDGDGDEGVSPPADETPKAPEPKAETPEPLAPVPAPAPEPKTEEPVVAKAPEVKAEPVVAPAPTPAPSTPVPTQTQEEYTQWLAKTEQDLADKVYQVSEAELNEYHEAPEKVLPRMMARVHTTVLQSTMMAVAQLFPQLMQNTQVQQTNEERLVSKFYDTWKDLKPHQATIQRDAILSAQTFKALNPTITEDELIQNVGAAMHAKYRIPVTALPVGANKSALSNVPPATPAGSTVRAGTTPPAGKDQSWQETFYEELQEET